MPEAHLLDQLSEVANILYDYFESPKKRTYLLYLVTSLLMALFIYLKSTSKRDFLNYIFDKQVWLSTSAITDYLMIVFNAFVKIFLIAPFVVLGVYLQNEINHFLMNTFGAFQYEVSQVFIILFYTLVIWLVGDFSSFLLHFLMHKIPFLWEFHKTHHSATVLNPFTQYRIHPVELLLVNIKGFIVYGVVTGIFFYFSGGEVGTIKFVGVNIFRFLFLFFGANLRHSHVQFKFATWLEYFLISPFQHQIHHSDAEQHFNKNMGSQLAIWDWLFGTLVTSEEVSSVKFGLGDENKEFNSFWKTIITPFRHMFR